MRLIMLTMVMFLTLICSIPQAQDISEIKSPRLRALAAQMEDGNLKAVDAFWKEMESKTTPLIESIEDDPNHVLLTLLWRGGEDTENVLIVGGIIRGHPLENTMEQLPNTDVWYKTYWTRDDLRSTYKFSPNDSLVVVPMNDVKAVAAQRKNYRRDPLNPTRPYSGASLIELPNAPEQPWIIKNAQAPKGETRTEKGFKSEILGNERPIGIYLPPGYDPAAEAYPLCLFFDLTTYTSVVPTPRILDNLTYAGKIPPMIGVFVGNPPGTRNYELPCNEDFARFLAEELMPWVHDSYNVSTDPSKNLIGGSSFGGLASSFVAFRYPQLFGNVISQSGSYW